MSQHHFAGQRHLNTVRRWIFLQGPLQCRDDGRIRQGGVQPLFGAHQNQLNMSTTLRLQRVMTLKIQISIC